jgi:predicted permease
VLILALAVAACAVAGACTQRRWGRVAEVAARRALLAALYTLVPFIGFMSLAGLEVTVDRGAGLALAAVALLLAAGVGGLIGRGPLGLSRPELGTVLCTILIVNGGFLGYPLSLNVLGEPGLAEAVAYDALVNAPMTLLVGFGIGAILGDRAGEGARARLRAFFLRNPPLLGAVAGMLAPIESPPAVLTDVAHVVVLLMIPIGFGAVGVSLAAAWGRAPLRERLRPSRPLALVLGARLILAPALLWALALPLIDLPDGYLLMAALPCGVYTLAIAQVYGLDDRLAAQSIAWSTAAVLAGVPAAQLVGLLP